MRKLKSVIVPVSMLILAIFFFAGSIQLAGPNGFNIQIPWIGSIGGSGQSGGTTITLPNGTQITTSIIPINQVSFKLMLVGTDVNGQNTTIFEKSTMPGLALLGPNAKVLKTIDLLGIVAVKSSTFFSTGAQAHFIINYSSTVGDTGKVKWRVIDITLPMTSNGTLALAALPPLRMLDQEIFSSHKVCPDPVSGCHDVPDQPLSQGQQRRVDWVVNAHVTITAPGFQPLTLMGSSGAVGEFNFDGSFSGGCTDCGGTGTGGTGTGGTGTGGNQPPTIGGVTITPSGIVKLRDFTESPPDSPINPPTKTFVDITASTTVAPDGTTTSIGTVKYTVVDKISGKVVSEKTIETPPKKGVSMDYSGTVRATTTSRPETLAPGQKAVAIALLESPFGYSRLDLTWLNGNVYLLNTLWFILGVAVFAALGVVLFVLVYLRPKEKKQRRK